MKKLEKCSPLAALGINEVTLPVTGVASSLGLS
jgi:hypothetical protein